MPLLWALILLALLILLFTGALYFARGQKPKSQHYGSWSQALPPWGRDHAVLDTAERLEREIVQGRTRARARRIHRARRSHNTNNL